MAVENKLCELVEKVSREHGSPVAWQVLCEYAPKQPARTMGAGKWENRALGILRGAASAAPVHLMDRLLAEEKTRGYGRGVFLDVIAAPAEENSGLVQVSNGQGDLVDKVVIENTSSAIELKVKKVRASIGRGERSQFYARWWLVFDDELVMVPVIQGDEWESINGAVRACPGIDAWSKVVLVSRFQPVDTTRVMNRWYHTFWEDAGHAPLPPSPMGVVRARLTVSA